MGGCVPTLLLASPWVPQLLAPQALAPQALVPQVLIPQLLAPIANARALGVSQSDCLSFAAASGRLLAYQRLTALPSSRDVASGSNPVDVPAASISSVSSTPMCRGDVADAPWGLAWCPTYPLNG